MKCLRSRRISPGVTLIELLCVMAIITTLAGLLLGPASRALHNVRAMKWAEDAQRLLDLTVRQLQGRYQGRANFPPVTLEQLEAGSLLDPFLVRFLKDRRVTFTPFAGSDPDEQVVIRVTVERGVLTDAEVMTVTKGTITNRPP